MARKRRNSLDYGGEPDVVSDVKPRATARPARESKPAAKARAKRPAGLDYTPEPFEGARAPAGPSPAAKATLEARGLTAPPSRPATKTHRQPAMESRPAQARSVEKNRGAPKTPPTPRATSPQPAQGPAVTSADKPARRPRRTAARRSAAPTTADRAARTVRLEPVVEAKLQVIAADFGVTLNAAMSIAIAHGFKALLDADLVHSTS